MKTQNYCIPVNNKKLKPKQYSHSSCFACWVSRCCKGAKHKPKLKHMNTSKFQFYWVADSIKYGKIHLSRDQPSRCKRLPLQHVYLCEICNVNWGIYFTKMQTTTIIHSWSLELEIIRQSSTFLMDTNSYLANLFGKVLKTGRACLVTSDRLAWSWY